MSPPWVLCLGAGKAQVPLIKSAQQLGWAVCVVDQNHEAAGMKLADESIGLSTYVALPILKKLDELAIPVKGLMARSSGQALYTAADLSESLNLNVLTHELVKICTVKSVMRKFGLHNHFKVPSGFLFKLNNDIENKVFPCVVRPDFPIRGKVGVKVCHNEQQLIKAAVKACELSANGQVDVSQFIPGRDVSLMVHMKQGRAFMVAAWDEINRFHKNKLEAIGLAVPARFFYQIEQQLLDFTNQFALLFPTVNYVLAFSFRIDEQQTPWLIEIHADLTGDLILDKLLPAATDKNVIKELVGGLLGSKFPCYSNEKLKPTGLLFGKTNNELIQSQSLDDMHIKIKKRTQDMESDYGRD